MVTFTLLPAGDRLNFKAGLLVGHWWLTPVILATQEAEIRRIVV
jgi:hypothetical protein